MERVPQGLDLLTNVTTTSVGAVSEVPFLNGGQAVFHAWLTGTSGTVTATVLLYGSNDPLAKTSQANAAKELLATFSLSGTGGAARTDGGVWTVLAPYRYFWGEVSAISGTGAAATLHAGY